MKSETTVKLQRVTTQNRLDTAKKQIDYLVERALGSNRGGSQGWQIVKRDMKDPISKNGKWIFTCDLYFQKTKGSSDPNVIEKQWATILDVINKCGIGGKYPWVIVDEDVSDVIVEEDNGDTDVDEPNATKVRHELVDVKDIVIPDEVSTIEDIIDRIPENILNGKDEEIENHQYFGEIFNRGPQIRTILSSIKSACDSNFDRTNHVLLYGLPACAKSAICTAVERTLGKGAVLRLDATSTTRAGLEKLFFKELEFIPYIVLIEEIEKVNEDALRIWLGALDDRREIRKVNFHMHQVREVKILCIATANDKQIFDNMMGGRPNYPGALSSRFVHQLECPRPDETVLRRILARDINKFGGKLEWIEPCVETAKKIRTNDPRKVLALLDGGDRLMDGSYVKDILKIYGITGRSRNRSKKVKK